MSHDQEQAPEGEPNQIEVTFSVNFVDGDEQPTEWGGRYKRPGAQPKPRSGERARNKKEYGKAEDLQAVFDSRAAYFQENPKPETLQEVAADSRALGHVLPDFPGVHDFVFEMETARMKSVDRLEVIEQAQRELEALLRQFEAGEVETGEIKGQLQRTTSALEKAERQKGHLSQELEAEATKDDFAEPRLTLEQIEAETLLARSTLSGYVDEIRKEDADKPEDERRIKTPKGGQLLRSEVKELKKFLENHPKRPNRRKKRYTGFGSVR